jgi:hypothetical protein
MAEREALGTLGLIEMARNNASPEAGDHYYELRLYEVATGRLEGLNRLMDEDAPAPFARYGIKPLIVWNGFAGPIAPLYGYLLGWRDLDARMAAWNAFYSDPDWLRSVADSYRDGQRVERANICFLKLDGRFTRPLAPGKPLSGRQFHELQIGASLFPREGDERRATADDRKALEDHGARVIGDFRIVLGLRTPQQVRIIEWPSMGARRAALGLGGEPGSDDVEICRSDRDDGIGRTHFLRPRQWPGSARLEARSA